MSVKDLSGGMLAYALLGLAAAMFTISAAGWWLAHHMAWWTYAATMGGCTFAWSFAKGLIEATRERRKAKR